jgi:anti-anti-sigma factor
MTDNAGQADPAPQHPAGSGALGLGPQARFEFVPASEGQPAAVRAVGDIDLTNVGQFQAALDEAAASGALTVDLTAVTYCDSAGIRTLFNVARKARLTIQVSGAGSITEALLKVSGLDLMATVITVD